MGDPHANIDVMRWLPGVRRNDDIQSPVKGAGNNNGGDTDDTKKKKKRKPASYCRKEAYKQARLALDNEARRSSSYLVSGISRIRPAHDNLYRDKFTYHGGIHTEQDDLIAMAFIDTLTSLHESLSPANRSSPTGSNEKEPLNTEELFAKISTLKNCVTHLPLFQPALSDDGKGSIRSGIGRNGTISVNGTMRYGETTFAPSYSNPPSIHSVDQLAYPGNGSMRSTFDGVYKATFAPLQQPNISAESLNGKDGTGGANEQNNMPTMPRSKTAEHGKIAAIEHTRSMVATHSVDKPVINPLPQRLGAPAPPGMFASHSHGLLPSAQHILHGHHHQYQYGHGHHAHPSHFNHLPRDIYPRDAMHGLPSQSHGSDHHPLHISSTESSSDGDDFHCDTMYGDEDDRHQPLAGYTNLDDLEEEDQDEPLEYDVNENEDEMKTKAQTASFNVANNGHNNNNNNEEEKSAKNNGMKRSTTWSKLNTIFRPRKLSDDESDEHNRKKKKRRKRKSKQHSNGYDGQHSNHGYDNLSISSHRNLSWDPDDEEDTTPVDPKMLEIPASLLKNKHKITTISNNNNDENDNNDNNDTQNENQNQHEKKSTPTKPTPAKIAGSKSPPTSPKSNHNKRSPPKSATKSATKSTKSPQRSTRSRERENSRSKSRSKKDIRDKQKHRSSRASKSCKSSKSKRPHHHKVASYSRSNLSQFVLEDDEHEKLPLKALKNQ
eukprot:CAMPEP_0201571704 /NCGR_PEP_ID=MMETSP0190_2-20130828/14607_1 /ASSEMBLY_ACC=CAM_ASM_000263 /TAXON_ID=37353 /ORGANISM="Rosalina sp." /LENGTH=717 /DNA_ID=CAMNT_0047996643 /DNA_START=236 /DNA_END=2392 /DNA_ORIENTATION=+